LIAWSLESSVFPRQDPRLSKTAYVAVGLAAAFLYFVSVLLHELGHALRARREGVSWPEAWASNRSACSSPTTIACRGRGCAR
jgi:hypothetical protein